MSLIRHRPNPDQAAIMAAVMSHAEQTGATILAEGIENDDHLAQALALGATLGQGWAFGRPAPWIAIRRRSRRFVLPIRSRRFPPRRSPRSPIGRVVWGERDC
ncbi:MAG: EAL domain-containing protein [Ilumatobacteraceae bacterium]